MPIKNQSFKFLKPISFKKLILFFSAAFLPNFYFEKITIAEDQVIVSFFLKNNSPFDEFKPLISIEKVSQPFSDKKLHTSPISKKIKKSKQVKKTAKGNTTTKTKKRKPANITNDCTEHSKDIYSIGYVQLGYDCDPIETLCTQPGIDCVSIEISCTTKYSIERNRCRNGELTRYYCDPEKISLFSSEQIKCPEGCDPSGLFCIPPKE